MHSRHPRTSLTLVVLGALLLASIAVGQRIGDRALFGSTERRSPVVAPLPTPVPQTSVDPNVSRNWKRLQVVSVATDPAFPDPRVTRPPTPTPSPRPTRSPPPPPTEPPIPTEPPLLTPLPNGAALPPPRAGSTPRASPSLPSYAQPTIQYSQ